MILRFKLQYNHRVIYEVCFLSWNFQRKQNKEITHIQTRDTAVQIVIEDNYTKLASQ